MLVSLALLRYLRTLEILHEYSIWLSKLNAITKIVITGTATYHVIHIICIIFCDTESSFLKQLSRNEKQVSSYVWIQSQCSLLLSNLHFYEKKNTQEVLKGITGSPYYKHRESCSPGMIKDSTHPKISLLSIPEIPPS
jgi:hypothetical protein